MPNDKAEERTILKLQFNLNWFEIWFNCRSPITKQYPIISRKGMLFYFHTGDISSLRNIIFQLISLFLLIGHFDGFYGYVFLSIRFNCCFRNLNCF